MNQHPAFGNNPQARFDCSVALIGEAALDDAALAAAAESVHELLGADSALLFTPTVTSADQSALWIGKALNDESIARYQAHYHKIDDWTHEVVKRRIASDAIIIGNELIPTRELQRSEWYTDFLHGYDIAHLPAAHFRRPVESLPNVYASFYRGPRSHPFEDLDGMICAQIIPYLRRSLEVRGRLSGSMIHVAEATAALDPLEHPIMLLDRTESVLFINKSAEQASHEQGGVRIRDSRPVLADHQDNKAINDAIIRAVRAGPSPSRRLRSAGVAVSSPRSFWRRLFRARAASVPRPLSLLATMEKRIEAGAGNSPGFMA